MEVSTIPVQSVDREGTERAQERVQVYSSRNSTMEPVFEGIATALEPQQQLVKRADSVLGCGR